MWNQQRKMKDVSQTCICFSKHMDKRLYVSTMKRNICSWSITLYLWTRQQFQFISRNLDDDRSAAKMGGESGPTGRAIFVWWKTKQKENGKHTVYMGTLYLYWSLYWIQVHVHAPIGVCRFCLLPLRRIWLKRLRVVRWFPALLQSHRLITSVDQAYRRPPIKLCHSRRRVDKHEKGWVCLPKHDHEMISTCVIKSEIEWMKRVTIALSVPSHISRIHQIGQCMCCFCLVGAHQRCVHLIKIKTCWLHSNRASPSQGDDCLASSALDVR